MYRHTQTNTCKHIPPHTNLKSNFPYKKSLTQTYNINTNMTPTLTQNAQYYTQKQAHPHRNVYGYIHAHSTMATTILKHAYRNVHTHNTHTYTNQSYTRKHIIVQIYTRKQIHTQSHTNTGSRNTLTCTQSYRRINIYPKYTTINTQTQTLIHTQHAYI